MNYDAIIFDVDGTLWDSTRSVCDAWNHAIFELAPETEPLTPEILRTQLGKPVDRIFEALFPQLYALCETEEGRKTYDALIDSCYFYQAELIRSRGGVSYPWAEEVLKALSARVPLYIVSNCQQGYIEDYLQYTGYAGYFSGHLCFGDTGLSKGGTILRLMERHGLKNPVYVGDIMGDAEACKEAGIDFIWASYGFGRVPPDARRYQIRCFADLLALLCLDASDIELPEDAAEKQKLCTGILKAYYAARSFEGMPSYKIVTFGCQMNVRDSEKLAGILEEAGCTEADSEENADIVLFNTCTIRENANEHLYGRLGRLKKTKQQHPERIIGICGCMMQEADEVEKIRRKYPYVDLIFGTHNFYTFPELMLRLLRKRFGLEIGPGEEEAQNYLADSAQDAQKIGKIKSSSHVSDNRELEKLQFRPVVRVWKKEKDIVEKLPSRRSYSFKQGVNISYGCNNFCTYCIVPYVRGRERDRRPEDILEEIRLLGEDGVKEIMLLGQNVNSYGRHLDDPISFAELLRRVDEVCDGVGIERIRFMTSHPKDLSDELIGVMAGGRHICRQFHLPLQSGSTPILKRMNRVYSRERFLERALALKDGVKGISLSTDIIVGFPGETEADFEDTLDVMKKVRFDAAYTFIYSPRHGTPAASYEDQTAPEVVKERFSRLLDLQTQITRENLSVLTGSVLPALIEDVSEYDPAYVSGRLENNTVVHVKGCRKDIGSIRNLRLTELKGFYFYGEVADG